MSEKWQLVNELHKGVRTNFKRRRVVIKGIHDLWTSDLAEMIPYSKVNRRFKYILVVVNCFTKFAFAEPLLNKTASEVSAAFERIINRAGYTPRHLWTDQGTEYTNKTFQALLRKHDISFYFTFQTTKASMAERFLRTLKLRLWKQFTMRGSYKWIDILQSTIDDYNHTKHRTIGMAPSNVGKIHEKRLLATVFKVIPGDGKKKTLLPGTLCRINIKKGTWEKKYQINWSTEVFRVRLAQNTIPTTYLLEDLDGKDIDGCFYREELSPTSVPNTYLVEKVLKKKGNQYYVKWMGFPKPQWINKNQIV